jgi:hypothetical protein
MTVTRADITALADRLEDENAIAKQDLAMAARVLRHFIRFADLEGRLANRLESDVSVSKVDLVRTAEMLRGFVTGGFINSSVAVH